jgi:hypothetical protein
MTISSLYNDIDITVFPQDYAAARQQWLLELASLHNDYQHLTHPCAGHGPNGESLFTDSAWIGAEAAENVLVILAATHGVEGFAGSAVQVDILKLLQTGQLGIPRNTALLLIHALTPWGYAWLRRCDVDGVDLNRNAIDFSAPPPETPEYQQLRSALFEKDQAFRQHILKDFSQQYGREALEKAISGGQYVDPAGPFYGGKQPAHGRLVCEQLIDMYGLKQRRLAVVDVHTGLGAYGYGEIICDHAPDSAGASVAKHFFGDAVTLPLAGTSSSVPKLGLLDYLWHAVMAETGCYITLEFGTYSTDELFAVLLRDHQLWAYQGNIPDRMAHSEMMRRHFCPADPAWREMVLLRARQVIHQAMRGLSC